MSFAKLRPALAASAALVAFTACVRVDEPFTLASIDDVERMLADGDVVVVDANIPEIFRRSHLPGARSRKAAPLAQLLPANKDARVVFYCMSPT
jgi:rhodanese-related sulfurtransferase